jgi:hypothetical protein
VAEGVGVTPEEQARFNAVADQHPGKTGIVGESVNEYGTPVSVLRCASCGAVVSICPLIKDPDAWGDGCLADTCASYDIERDMDLFFEPLMDHGLIGRDDA